VRKREGEEKERRLAEKVSKAITPLAPSEPATVLLPSSGSLKPSCSAAVASSVRCEGKQFDSRLKGRGPTKRKCTDLMSSSGRRQSEAEGEEM